MSYPYYQRVERVTGPACVRYYDHNMTLPDPDMRCEPGLRLQLSKAVSHLYFVQPHSIILSQIESRGLGNIQEGAGVDEDDDVDDEDSEESKYEMCKGTLLLKKPPTIVVWEKELADECSLKTELDQGSPKDAQEVVEELQAAFGDLKGFVVDLRRDSRKDALDVLTHVGFSVTEIVGAINRINKRGRRWVSDIGSAMRPDDMTSPSSRR